MPEIEFKSLFNDLKTFEVQLQSAKIADPNVTRMLGELTAQVKFIAEHFDQRHEEQQGMIDELIEASESLIQPELAEILKASVLASRNLASNVLNLQPGQTLSDVEVKRFHDAAKLVLSNLENAEKAVDEVAIEYEDEEPVVPSTTKKEGR